MILFLGKKSLKVSQVWFARFLPIRSVSVTLFSDFVQVVQKVSVTPLLCGIYLMSGGQFLTEDMTLTIDKKTRGQ